MSHKKWIGLAVIIVAAVALVVAGYLHWRHGKLYPSTDNAYVEGTVITVASRIPGTLLEVPVEENSWIEQGAVIAKLDPRDNEQAVSEARADLAKSQASLELDKANIAGAEAQLAVARSQASLARSDRTRYGDLEQRGSVAARQAEQAQTSAEVAAAQVTAAQKSLAAVQARLEVDREEVQRMRSRLDQALLKLSYATINAPADGLVADKSAQVGQVVAAGQPLCQLAQLEPGHVWVDANFKETQLDRVHVGQPVTVTFDAYGSREFHGTVESLSAGTGAAFSLLPPQNATGNWVKIVQRLPVRIALDLTAEQVRELRLGLTASVTIDTRSAAERR